MIKPFCLMLQKNDFQFESFKCLALEIEKKISLMNKTYGSIKKFFIWMNPTGL